MAISKEQWGKVEAELSHSFGHVVMKCDEYELGLTVVPLGTLQYGIAVYVNGYFKGKWLMEDCEERRRFLRPVERFLLNAKERMEWLKIYGGKRAKKADVERVNRKIVFYQSYWTSAKSLRRHLEKNNSTLELVSLGGIEVASIAAAASLPAEPAAA
jgi:hypothetical protein